MKIIQKILISRFLFKDSNLKLFLFRIKRKKDNNNKISPGPIVLDSLKSVNDINVIEQRKRKKIKSKLNISLFLIFIFSITSI